MTSNGTATLYLLGDRGQTVDGSSHDVRGRTVTAENGDRVGKVADLLVDDREQKVRFLLVEHGGFLGIGETKTLIPVDAVTRITEDEVIVDESRDRVASAPGYSPELVDDRPHHSSVYEHYGRPPHWGPNYIYPMGMGFPTSTWE